VLVGGEFLRGVRQEVNARVYRVNNILIANLPTQIFFRLDARGAPYTW